MPRGGVSRPTALKIIAGEKKSRINFDEPQPEEGLPECPTDNPAVREIWDYTVNQLRRMRVITMGDRDTLYAYCQAVADHREACRLIDEEGMVLHIGSGINTYLPHPALKIQAAAVAVIKTLGVEFGLTPAARTRIKVADQKMPKDQGQEKTPSRLLSG